MARRLIREALEYYLNQRANAPKEYAPTASEVKAIERGRKQMNKGEYFTLDEFKQQLVGDPRPKSAG